MKKLVSVILAIVMAFTQLPVFALAEMADVMPLYTETEGVLPEPTAEPTAEPTVEPTAEPTAEPTQTPAPSATPEVTMTPEPTAEPTAAPTQTPVPSAIPEAAAVSDESTLSGTCGDNATWKLEGTVLIISGTGPMEDYFYNYGAPWYTDPNPITEIIIEDGITHIGDNAFWGCDQVTDVTIPSSVTSIGASAFSSCASIKSIEIPESVTSIGMSAFGGCAWLEDIVIPLKVTTIEEYTFFGCDGLKSFTIPANITNIKDYAFQWCGYLTEINFEGDAPNFGTTGVFDRIEATVYYPCDNDTWTEDVRQNYGGTLTWLANHTEVIDPAVEPTATETGLTEGKHCSVCNEVLVVQEVVPALMMGACGDNATWKLEDGVLTISGTGETYVYTHFEEDPEYYDPSPWYGYREQITAVVVEEGITALRDEAFYCCNNLTSVSLPSTLKTIYVSTFAGCTSLEEIDLPANLECIDASVFSMCTALKKLVIPSKVKEIHRQAFVFCDVMKEVVFEGDAPWFAVDVFMDVTTTVYYPCDNDTWTEDVRQNYGGTLTWLANHTEVIDPAVEPTATETGLTEGKHCSVCKEVLVVQEVVPVKTPIGTGTPDSTPPTLNSITLSTTTVTAPGTIEVTMDASDDVSGADRAEVYFYCEATKKQLYVHLRSEYYDDETHEEKPYADGLLHGTLEIDQYVETGTFCVNEVHIYDVAENISWYFINASDASEQLPAAVKELQFTVVDADEFDSTPPTLNSITLSTTTVTAPGTIEVTMDASDDVSGADRAEVYFYCEATKKQLYVHLRSEYYDDETHEDKPYADGLLHGTLEIDQYVETGTFCVNEVHIYDVAENISWYFINASDANEQLPAAVKNLQLRVTESDTPDSTPPTLNSITLSTTTVTAPGMIEATMDASDAVSGADRAEVYFYCEATKKQLYVHLRSEYYDDETHEDKPYADGLLHGTLEIDQYVETGTFYVNEVHIYDVAENISWYFINASDTNEQLPAVVEELTFKVYNLASEITTSVSKPTFVEEVTAAPDEAYIVADFSGNSTLPEDVFDGIAGTEKVLDLTSEGVTWRFQGSDITGPAKDIELGVEIVKAESDTSSDGQEIQDKLDENPAYIMRFADNGTLPGKATIQVKVDYAMRRHLGSSQGLNVYYYNNRSGKLELVAKNLYVVNDTYVEFPITHCSDYILTAADMPCVYPITLDLQGVSGSTDAVWIDGAEYKCEAQDGKIILPLEHTDAKTAVMYAYNSTSEQDPHKVYPTKMYVWMLSSKDGVYTATRVSELDNVLQYAGSSIRITGNKGIRMITSVPADVKKALTDKGIAGYTLVEYGTVVAWDEELGNNPLVLGKSYSKPAYAYKKGVADPIFNQGNGVVQYTNVLVGFSNDMCIPDLAMRPYIILQDAAGEQVTLYGGIIHRSIGYIACQNRAAFQPGTSQYAYIWEIIHHVYGDAYDAEYQG